MSGPAGPDLVVRPVTAGGWAELAAFFGPSGAYSGCWCTWFRQRSAEFSAGCRDGAAGNRALMQRLVGEGRVPGLLAYDGAHPAGWVSVAPRADFGRVLRSPVLDRSTLGEPGVWSVVCFWVPRARRGTGVATALLAGAVRHARQGGARVVEGYPVDTAGARRPAAALFTGTVGLFAAAGFTEAYRRRPERPVLRREM